MAVVAPKEKDPRGNRGKTKSTCIFSPRHYPGPILASRIHLNIRNPWYSADTMDAGVVHDLMESKLLNTYTAFNLSEEEELFERLSQNLDEDLLDPVYLDSRRRLTMGLREGSTVTVKEVLLGELGEAIDADNGNRGTQISGYLDGNGTGKAFKTHSLS